MRKTARAVCRHPGAVYCRRHHRCASAVKVGLKRREEKPDYTGQEEFNFFLAVAFPDSELEILPYNRVVRDLNGLSPDALISQIEQRFIVKHRMSR